jgi:hypothetical protein
VADKLQRVAFSCPPGFQPELTKDQPGFIAARVQCNKEMMKRALSLCSQKVRNDISQHDAPYVPYIVRHQAKRNIQKLFPHVPLNANAQNCNVFYTWMQKNSPFFHESDDNLAEMIRHVAHSMADPAQTGVDTPDAAAEVALINAKNLQSLAGSAGRGSRVVTFTLDDIRTFQPGKLHETSKVRSLDWALDEKGMNDNDGPNTRARFNKYKLALEKLLVPGEGGKGAKGGPKGSKGGKTKGKDQATLLVFQNKCEEMGVQFNEVRLNDIATLSAVLKARMDQLDG